MCLHILSLLYSLCLQQVAESKSKEYDLDSKDPFWIKNANVPFPQVAENVDVELAKYKESSDKITRLSGGSTAEELMQKYVQEGRAVLFTLSKN